MRRVRSVCRCRCRGRGAGAVRVPVFLLSVRLSDSRGCRPPLSDGPSIVWCARPAQGSRPSSPPPHTHTAGHRTQAAAAISPRCFVPYNYLILCCTLLMHLSGCLQAVSQMISLAKHVWEICSTLISSQKMKRIGNSSCRCYSAA